LRIIIEKSESGEIIVKNQETELYKAIECKDEVPKKLIVFQGINNASPAVLNILNSIFVPGAKILLSNGSTLEKGKMNIIGVFNKGKENINKDKIPAGILTNCIYYILENNSEDDIKNIIDNLFQRMEFGEEENFKYTKNYLVDNLIEKEPEEKLKIDQNYLTEKFLEAKKKKPKIFLQNF
jgi:hypothetical protein